MKERKKKMRREKNERKVPRDLNLPQIRIKRAQRATVLVVQMATPNACARSLKENIFIKFMRPRRRSARAPVNRFPEDVDQFRLERRRGMEERKGERKGSRPLGERASERESSSLHLRPLHHRPPFFLFLLLPPSIRRSPPIPRTPSLSLFFFESSKKMRPSVSEFFVASAVPIKRKKKTPFLSLRALVPFFFRSRRAKQS